MNAKLKLLVCLLAGWTLHAGAQIRDGGIDPWNLGKGDWIYSMMDATNQLSGHVPSVTNETSLMLFYRSVGVRYMMIKTGTGTALYNGCYSGPQFTAALVNIAHANGILIFGYSRSYATNTVGEAAIADYVFNQGADGFVWDAESEWESATIGSQGPALAWAQCSLVRSNWPNKFLAHAPFPIISYHSSFPYKEFGYWCDAVMPQIYHSGWTGVKGTASGGINWSDANWASWQNSLSGSSSVINGQTIWWTNAIKPLAPVENVYGVSNPYLCNGPASPQTDKDVMEFLDYLSADPNTVTRGGYQGANFWRADLHGATQWNYIGAGTSGSFPGKVKNIVIDDPSAVAVGGWTAVRTFSNGSFYGNGSGTDTNSFGTNYLTCPQGSGSRYVRFTPTILVPGDYDVYQWHVFRPDASASVPCIITYNGGSATVYANQQTNAGYWSLLGRYNFAAGTAGNVRLTDAIPESGGVALADGLKLVFVPPSSTPAPPDGLSATAAGNTQINVTWRDRATNETGFVVARAPAAAGPYTDIAAVSANVTNYSNTGLSPNTTYYYEVRATNWLGTSAYSAPAGDTTSGSPTPPNILTQPGDATVIAGQDASFSVVASGSIPLSYQWWLGNTPISGGTNSVYTRSNARPAHAGTYAVVITNAYGAVTSAPALLTVNFSLTATANSGGSVAKNPDQTGYAPGATVVITANPASGFVFSGWSGDATGTNNPLALTLTTNLAVAASFNNTNTDLILDNTNAAVTFNGSWQTGTSSVDKYGTDYRFASTVASNPSNATYQPYINVPGYYDVYIWYPQGSNRATNAPWSVVYSGGSINVAVDQTGNGGKWVLLAAARPFVQGNSGYVRLSNNTGYSGKVVLADAVRFIYVGPLPTPPGVFIQPPTQTIKVSSNATFTAVAGGTLPLTYQWFFQGHPILGATASFYTRTNAQTNDAGGYQVSVTNVAGWATSSIASLFVLPLQPPQITTQPQSQAAVLGGSAQFSVGASSTGSLRYQWRLNGADLAGRTDAGLSLSGLQPADFGPYTVRVSNDDGALISDPATLTVALSPSLQSVTVQSGWLTLTLSTEPGPTYTVEYKNGIEDAQWQPLTSVAGTGGSVQISDGLTNQVRLYRIHVQ